MCAHAQRCWESARTAPWRMSAWIWSSENEPSHAVSPTRSGAALPSSWTTAVVFTSDVGVSLVCLPLKARRRSRDAAAWGALVGSSRRRRHVNLVVFQLNDLVLVPPFSEGS